MSSTNKLFNPGQLTIIMDGGAGSSGKGRIGSYITENADNWTFACNTFSANAAHWVKLDDGRQYLYKSLNSCAYNKDKYEKMYIGAGSAIDLDSLLHEIEENGLDERKVGIDPLAVIIQDKDANYERGVCGFDGEDSQHGGTMAFGSTCSGVGAATARKILRRPDRQLVRDVDKLKPFVCDVSDEIMRRLGKGEAGLLEIAQGFQLSVNHPYFYPACTYRNVTVAQGLSDMFLPTRVAGPVILNFRTFPIRINSNKYISTIDGHHLTWDEIQSGVPHTVYEGTSGHWYPDQKELTWEEVTQRSGYDKNLMEITSKTKLPRRVASFSWANLHEAIICNDTGRGYYLSVNFADYVDKEMAGKRGFVPITDKFKQWINENFRGYAQDLVFIGTGPLTNDTVLLNWTE